MVSGVKCIARVHKELSHVSAAIMDAQCQVSCRGVQLKYAIRYALYHCVDFMERLHLNLFPTGSMVCVVRNMSVLHACHADVNDGLCLN